MPATNAKDQGPVDAFPINSSSLALTFPTVTLAASQAASVVQAILFLPTAVKIYRVIAGFDAATVAGTCSINVVVGTAAPFAVQFSSLPYPDTQVAGQPISPNTQAYPPPYASNRQKLFLSNRAVTMTADTATIITPNDSAATGAYAPNTPGFTWDGIWGPGGSLLTLRTVTNGSASGNLYVTMLCKSYDPNFAKPILTGFNPATDIP